LRNIILIAAALVRVGIVYAFFRLTTPHVGQVGVGLLLAGVVTLIGAVWVWLLLAPGLHIRFHGSSWRTLGQLTERSGWTVIYPVGVIIFVSVVLLVVNLRSGADAAGRYGTALQWSTMLRGLAGAIAGVLGPTILALYARGDIPGLVRYARG